MNYLIEAGAFERTRKDGKSYIVVKDYDKAHEAVGKLLAEIMRIKAEGDYEGIKNLVQKYGVHFDPALRDEVVARYKTLDIAPYYTGIYADLAPVRDPNGKIRDMPHLLSARLPETAAGVCAGQRDPGLLSRVESRRQENF